MVLAVFGGCAPAQQPGESTAAESTAGALPHSMQVGYSRVDITPEESVQLAGGGSQYSERVEDPLYATCIAFTDETGNTVLIYELDLIRSAGVANMARNKIGKATGVNPLQIYMCSTHNHSGPDPDGSSEAEMRYGKALSEKLVKVAEEAMADRKPVTGAYITCAYPEGLNFCRHHILADGSKTGWASPATKSAVAHLRDADNELQLIKLTRDGGKDVVLMNWQGHPDARSDAPNAIASDVDVVRREIEPLLDCHFAYFLGGSGNVNSQSYVKSELQSDWYIKDYRERGKKLAEHAVEAAKTFQKVETGTLRIDSTKHAIESKGGGSIDVPIAAVGFGDLAICFAPYEMFTECGQEIKKQSPFKMTIVSTCSTGNMSYIPSAYVYEYSSYEGDNSSYAPGAAESLVEGHVAQLKRVFDAK